MLQSVAKRSYCSEFDLMNFATTYKQVPCIIESSQLYLYIGATHGQSIVFYLAELKFCTH